jgi:hypothetical protein
MDMEQAAGSEIAMERAERGERAKALIPRHCCGQDVLHVTQMGCKTTDFNDGADWESAGFSSKGVPDALGRPGPKIKIISGDSRGTAKGREFFFFFFFIEDE